MSELFCSTNVNIDSPVCFVGVDLFDFVAPNSLRFSVYLYLSKLFSRELFIVTIYA